MTHVMVAVEVHLRNVEALERGVRGFASVRESATYRLQILDE